MKLILKYSLLLAFAIGFIGTACEKNDINMDAGTFPETGGIDLSFGILRSANYSKENPLIDMDHKNMSDEFHIELTQPAPQTGNYTVSIDESQVAIYNQKNSVNYPIFPTELITLDNEGILTIEKGKLKSNNLSITFKYDASLNSAVYLLPLTIQENTVSSVANEHRTLYYRINVWGDVPAEYNATGKNYTQIAGIDPEFTNPLLINKLYLVTLNEPLVYFNPFDYVNLQSATVKADENHLPYLFLKDDLAYVLLKRDKYIVPLQKLAHKVCLSITGGGDGIGFSNMDDSQLKIFIYRIKQTIDLYKLDGVNLYDKGFAINKSDQNIDAAKGLCNFVAELRKVLGEEKTITYTQTVESPTGITNISDNIKLGELVDYAWTDQLNKIINPWDHPDQWWTSPIAGLSKEKWGALNSDIKISNDDINTLINAIENEMSMISEEINHVFVVNKVEYVTQPTDAIFTWYMYWGGDCNLYDEYETVQIGPDDYGGIHTPFIPKDY